MKTSRNLFYCGLFALLISAITQCTEINTMSVIMITGSMVIKGVKEDVS